MRDEDKPFVCYKQGWNIKIWPRNATGWRFLGLWMLALLAPTLALVPFAFRFDDTPYEAAIVWAVIPVLVFTGVIVVLMIRWMMARSEMIDLSDVTDFKRERDRARKRRG